MSNKTTQKLTLEHVEQLQRRDRNRLLVMTFAAVALGIGYLVSKDQATSLPDELEEPTAQIQEGPAIVIPEFDLPQILERIRDGSQAERVVVDAEVLTSVFNYGRIFTDRHFEAAGARELTGAALEEIEADPSAVRVKPYRAHGWIERIEKRRREASLPEEWFGTLQIEGQDGSRDSSPGFAHFVVLDMPAETEVGDFVRIDGMFLKLYRREIGQDWYEGPLLLGPRGVSSVPRSDLSKVIAPDLGSVQDDEVADVSGLDDTVTWDLMAQALQENDLETAKVDWESAPVLDSQTMGRLFQDGEQYRGKPFRFEVCRNLGTWTESAGENSLRLTKVTKGWIGNMTWKGPAPVLNFMAPFDKPELNDRYGGAKYLQGRGFFYKNYAYEQSNGTPGRAPVFVLAGIEAFIPTVDPTPRYMMWGMLIGAVLMSGALWFLLMRDRKKAEELQAELIRRRRERREGRVSTTPGSA